MPIELILGTAGHIDHGKTSLVKALTGVDTDRLPEEKARGITIDLGFAELDLGDIRLGIVDVPGHERFVRNMVAGATGIDLALLVVAADDSVKPQTREHLEILKLLNIELGMIALTKCDLPDSGWIDLVEEEIRELVKGSFLEQAPIVRTSVQTGQGIDELKRTLAQLAQRAAESPRRRSQGPFRLCVDRSFTIAGHGAVVTGSVSSGSAKVGDELMLEPGHVPVRIRGLQNHDRAVMELHRGQRAAINLGGVRHEEIVRGQELATLGYLVPSRLITVRLNLLPSAPRPLKNRARVRCHMGTAELMAGVILLDRERLAPGETAFAQVLLREVAVSVWGQPYIIRAESPVVTLGGGEVLDANAQLLPKQDKTTLEQLERLASGTQIERASAAIYFFGLREWQPIDLSRAAGVDSPEELVAELQRQGELVDLAVSHSRKQVVHRLVIESMFTKVEAALAKEHDAFPLRSMLDKSRIIRRLDYLGPDALLESLLAVMKKFGRLRESERGIAMPGRGPQLSQNEQKLLNQIIQSYQSAGFAPPMVEELQATITRNQAVVTQLISLASAEGLLVEIGPGFFLHADAEKKLRDVLRQELQEKGPLTMSQIRDVLGTSRKFSVPICEYLDKQGFTKRSGDLRMLA